jgi:hypothetical protein
MVQQGRTSINTLAQRMSNESPDSSLAQPMSLASFEEVGMTLEAVVGPHRLTQSGKAVPREQSSMAVRRLI